MSLEPAEPACLPQNKKNLPRVRREFFVCFACRFFVAFFALFLRAFHSLHVRLHGLTMAALRWPRAAWRAALLVVAVALCAGARSEDTILERLLPRPQKLTQLNDRTVILDACAPFLALVMMKMIHGCGER